MHCAADPLSARPTDCGSYTALLPLYFARTDKEQAACVTGLPADVGDETDDAVPRLASPARHSAAVLRER